MKILLVGAAGVLGSAVARHLREVGHEVVTAGRNSGDERVDLTDEASVQALFERVGKVDALVATVGKVSFAKVSDMTAEAFNVGLQDKLLGQVRLALIGQHYLNEGGSITLTTGIIAHQPIAQGCSATAVNTAIEGFVTAAACEMSCRINAVSPTVLTEALDAYAPFFPGFKSVSAAEAAWAFRRSVDGVQSGQIFRVGY